MSLDRHALIRDYLDALMSRSDIAGFFAPDVSWRTMETGEEVIGAQAVADYIRVFHTVLFDAAPRLHSLVVSGDFACLEADFVGRHTAEFAGIPATGAPVDVAYCMTYGLSDRGIEWLHAYLPIGQLVAQVQAVSSART